MAAVERTARKVREFQFVVTPVLLVEEDGGVPYPLEGEPTVCRGIVELQKFIDEFPSMLALLNGERPAE